MTLVQSHYKGRGDSQSLNSGAFDHPVDTGWTQVVGQTFRVRFEIDETAGTPETFGGQLEARLNAGSWFDVTGTSGTVTAALSDHFLDSGATIDVIQGSALAFTSGTGSTSGAANSVALNDQHTEVEYALRLTGVSNGGTINLRVADADTYANTPALVALNLSDRDRVRQKVGDTDDATLILTDAEIDTCLAAWPSNIDLGAADAAAAIAATYSRDFNFSTDAQKFNRRERVLHYMALAARLRRRGGTFEWPRT